MISENAMSVSSAYRQGQSSAKRQADMRNNMNLSFMSDEEFKKGDEPVRNHIHYESDSDTEFIVESEYEELMSSN